MQITDLLKGRFYMKKKFLSAVCALVLVFGSAAALPQGFAKLDSAITASAETYGDYEYSVLDDGTVEISKYNGSDEEVNIPSTIDGKKVTSIGGSAFDGCTMISSVSIGKGVALVKTNAFPDCFMLSTMSIHNPKTCFEKNSIDSTNLTDINYMGTCDEFLRYFNLNAFIEGDDTININCSDGILRAKYFQDVNRYKFIF
jgi:hypothetical protein